MHIYISYIYISNHISKISQDDVHIYFPIQEDLSHLNIWYEHIWHRVPINLTSNKFSKNHKWTESQTSSTEAPSQVTMRSPRVKMTIGLGEYGVWPSPWLSCVHWGRCWWNLLPSASRSPKYVYRFPWQVAAGCAIEEVMCIYSVYIYIYMYTGIYASFNVAHTDWYVRGNYYCQDHLPKRNFDDHGTYGYVLQVSWFTTGCMSSRWPVPPTSDTGAWHDFLSQLFSEMSQVKSVQKFGYAFGLSQSQKEYPP